MSKKSIYSLLIALAIPVLCYLWLKSASDTALDMPSHYLLDTVYESVVDGKIKSDSIWHTTKNTFLKNLYTVFLLHLQFRYFVTCG